MAEHPEDPLVLLEMLEILGACRGSVSYADICVYLSGRFSLQPLLELRSLLYSTACRDPCFPATLFRERLHPPCSNRLSAAADVVSLFNLLMHTRVAPTYMQNVQSLTACQACGRGFVSYNWPAALSVTGRWTAPQECQYENLPCKAFSPNTESSCARTTFETLAYTRSYMHNKDSMQNTHSVDTSSDAINQGAEKTSQANQEARIFRSCSQKRSAFKEGCKFLPIRSVESVGQSEQSPDGPREDGEDLLYITQKNPYPDPATYANDHHTYNPASYTQLLHDPMHLSGSDTRADNAAFDDATNPYSPHQTQNNSLGELQTSTYFGPAASIGKTQQAPALQGKSHSLDIDSRAADERHEQENNDLQKPRAERSVLEKCGGRKPGVFTLSFDGSSFDIPGFNPHIVSSVRDTFKRLSGMSLEAWYDWSASTEGVASVGTQTEPANRRALRSLMLSEKLSIDNPDITEEDISAIFRFLDDISMCGSMAVLPVDGGGGAQDEGGAGLPERRERSGKLRRLFYSMEAPEEGVQWGMGRLLQRVADLEQQLQPIAELRDQLALVLSTLNRLEQRERTACSHSHQMHMQPRTQSHSSPRVSSGPDGPSDAAAKRRRQFVHRTSKAHTESSRSDAYREQSISFTKESHIQPAKSGQLTTVYKKEKPAAQEVMGFHLMPPEAHIPSRRASLQNSQNSTNHPKVTWSQSDLTPLDPQAPESVLLWTDETYTPASDALLRRRRSHAYTRCSRTQMHRIAALIITATIIIILLIVIPLNTA